MRVPVAGGVAQTLTSAEGHGFGIAVDAMNVFWTSAADGGAVSRVAIGGGNPRFWLRALASRTASR